MFNPFKPSECVMENFEKQRAKDRADATMSKYALKKDLPFLKAGAIFKYSNEKQTYLAVDDWGEYYLFSYSQISNFPEWFTLILPGSEVITVLI